jgi:hypothetical protein
MTFLSFMPSMEHRAQGLVGRRREHGDLARWRFVPVQPGIGVRLRTRFAEAIMARKAKSR